MGLATQFPTLEFKFASFLKKALSNKQDEEDNLGHHYPPPPIGFWNGWKVFHNLVG